MNKLKQKAIDIVNDTVKYYSEDTKRRAKTEKGCRYLTDDGRMCAVGRQLNKKQISIYGDSKKNATFLFFEMRINKLKGLGSDFWSGLQRIHDQDLYWNESKGMTELGLDSVEDFKSLIKKQTIKQLQS